MLGWRVVCGNGGLIARMVGCVRGWLVDDKDGGLITGMAGLIAGMASGGYAWTLAGKRNFHAFAVYLYDIMSQFAIINTGIERLLRYLLKTISLIPPAIEGIQI